MKKAKKKVITPLQRVRREARDLKARNNVLDHSLNALAASRDIERKQSADKVASRDHDIQRLNEQLQIKEGAIAVREAKIAELVAERDRIIRLVEVFTSVQLTTHGTELRVSAAAPSAPIALRKDAIKSVEGSVIAAAKNAEAKEMQIASYRRPMYSIQVNK